MCVVCVSILPDRDNFLLSWATLYDSSGPLILFSCFHLLSIYDSSFIPFSCFCVLLFAHSSSNETGESVWPTLGIEEEEDGQSQRNGTGLLDTASSNSTRQSIESKMMVKASPTTSIMASLDVSCCCYCRDDLVIFHTNETGVSMASPKTFVTHFLKQK